MGVHMDSEPRCNLKSEPQEYSGARARNPFGDRYDTDLGIFGSWFSMPFDWGHQRSFQRYTERPSELSYYTITDPAL